jgi:hypothetical protein
MPEICDKLAINWQFWGRKRPEKTETLEFSTDLKQNVENPKRRILANKER